MTKEINVEDQGASKWCKKQCNTNSKSKAQDYTQASKAQVKDSQRCKT